MVLCPLNDSNSPFPPSGVYLAMCCWVTGLLSSLSVACEDEQRWPSPGRPVHGCGEMLTGLQTGMGCERLLSELLAVWWPPFGPPFPHLPECEPTSALWLARSAGPSPFPPACRPPGSCQSAPPSPSCAR